jgi:hypothetical protein
MHSLPTHFKFGVSIKEAQCHGLQAVTCSFTLHYVRQELYFKFSSLPVSLPPERFLFHLHLCVLSGFNSLLIELPHQTHAICDSDRLCCSTKKVFQP